MAVLKTEPAAAAMVAAEAAEAAVGAAVAMARGQTTINKEQRKALWGYSFGRLLGGSSATRPRQNASLVGPRALFLHEGEKTFLLFEMDFISWHKSDSAWVGVITVTLDVPPGAHFNVSFFQSGRFLGHCNLKLFSHVSLSAILNSLSCSLFLTAEPASS